MFSLPLGDGLSLGGMAAVVGELVRLPRTASPTVNIWRPFADREDGISSTFSLLVIGASSDRRTDRVGIAGMDERKFFGGIHLSFVDPEISETPDGYSYPDDTRQFLRRVQDLHWFFQRVVFQLQQRQHQMQ